MPKRTLIALVALLATLLTATVTHAEDPKELVFVFQKQKDPSSIRESADKLGARLTELLGMPVKTQVPTDYGATVQAMVSEQADFAYFSAIPYLLARRDANARIVLAEQRKDAKGKLRAEYDSVIVVRKDSPLQSMDDVKAKAGELNFVFTSPTSTSGFIFATKRLVEEGILKPKQDARKVFASASFGGSYTEALQQVIDGRGDLCAVSFYTVEGETADVYLKKEERAKLRVLTRTPGVPTHLVAVRGGISKELEARVRKALLTISQENPELLSDVYGAKTFVEVDGEKHVAGALKALEYLGMKPEQFTN
jgi:phosphonate transport system substrate-binding protein